ncbi:periaxin isoform X2 [Lithobates pipiens]
MCDCFNQIFGVTWSPSSSYGVGEERLERHVVSKVPEPTQTTVKEKFSPLKQRSPPAGRPHLSLEEIKDADRAAQKEKLHEELKKVLLLKGQRNSAETEEPKMETKISITEEKLRASEMVEVIVETEAQSGMSGINISGGGKDGLFISDVLKDSPAAKNLPLQEGDQIISARVYFENIKYEDALKILQYAEHYKVSYCLKRTVPSSDVTVSSESGTVEVKGPKAKMPKMFVKSLTPVKKKKKKVPSQVKDSDVSVEAVKGSELSVSNMDIPPVDVEFSFPSFSKLLKTKGGAEGEAITKTTEVSTAEEQKGLKMKFPRFRLKDTAGRVSVDEHKAKARAEGEVKEKSSAKFGISVPKMKKTKIDVIVSKPDLDVSMPKAAIETKEETIFKAPQVELDIPLHAIKTEAPDIPEKIKVPGLSTAVKIPDVEIKMPTASVVELEAQEAKFSIPQLPKVGICTPHIEKEQDIAIRVDRRSKTEITLPSIEIAAPKVNVDLSLPKVEGAVEVEPPESTSHGFQMKLPKFSMSSKTSETGFKATPPEIKKNIEVKVSDDKLKMPSIKTPQIGISIPKGKVDGDSPDGQRKSAIRLPSLEISVPNLDVDVSVPRLETGDIAVEQVGVPDVTLKMPKISPPGVRMKVKDAYAARAHMGDAKTEKSEAGGTVEIPDVMLQMPKLSLPKVGLKGDKQEVPAEEVADKGEDEEFKLKGPKIKLPSFGILSSKEKSETEAPEKTSTELEGKLKFPSVTLPSVDISLPQVQVTEPSKLEVTAPSAKIDVKAPKLESPDLKLKMPKISIPKLDISTKLSKPDASPPKVGIHIPRGDSKIKDDVTAREKQIIPELDISIPKIKPVDFGITLPKSDDSILLEKPKLAMKLPKVESDAIAFDGKMGDSKIGLPSFKMPVLEVETPSLQVDLNLPKMKTDELELVSDETETKFQMPKLNLPKLSDVAKDMDVELDVPKITGDLSLRHVTADTKVPGLDIEDKGVKMSLPKVEIGLGKVSDVEVGELKQKVDVKLPKVKLEKHDVEDVGAKIKFPSVKLPSVEITTPNIPDVDIDTGVPKVAMELSGKEDLAVDVSSEAEAKWKGPKFSLRKFGISGPKVKKVGEVDIKTSHTEKDTEVAVKGPKLKMPKFGMVFPKAKQDVEAAGDKKASKGKLESLELSTDGKVKLPSIELPTIDIKAPKLEVDIAVPKCEESQILDKPPEINIDIPDTKLSLPKFSLPKFAKGKGTDEDTESEKVKVAVSPSKKTKTIEASAELSEGSIEAKGKGKDVKMKMPAIKMPSFGISKKDADATETKVEIKTPDDKTRKAKETKDDNGKMAFIKMPMFKMSPPKVQAPKADVTLKGSKDDLNLSDIHVKVPQVTLPSFGIKGDQAAEATLSKTETKISERLESLEVQLGEKVKIPSLEISTPPNVPALQISVPCVKPDICGSLPKAEVDVSDADIKRYEGDLKIPKIPSIDVSLPDIELDIGLPKATVDTTLASKTSLSLEKSAAKLAMPKFELPKFGEPEAKEDSSMKGSKIKMPHVDISFPKVKLDEEDIPFIESELKMHGSSAETRSTEASFTMPSVELPKMSTPKIRAPELELDVSLSKDDVKFEDKSKTPKADLDFYEGEHELKLKMPKIKLSKFGSHSAGVQEDTVKIDAKASKQEEGSDSGIMGFKMKMPKLQVGSLKGKVDVEKEGDHKVYVKGDAKASDHEDSENGRLFKIRMPSFGITRDSADAATEPLQPSEEGTKFKMPKISLPDVGFSGSDSEALVYSEGGQASTMDKIKSTTSSSIENLEIDLGLKMPKIKMPTIGLPGRKGDDEMEMSLNEESEAKKSFLKMPDVELSAPKIKAHGEYEVDSAKLDTEGSDSLKKSSKTKGEHKHHGTTENDSENKLNMNLPKVSVSLPKAVTANIELSAPKLKPDTDDYDITLKSIGHREDHEVKKAKKTFSLGKVKDKTTSDVDRSLEIEGPDLKIKLPKIKMKPSFSRSRGKGKGAEVNGEPDAADADIGADGSGKSSKIKFPKLGFSSSKTHSGEIGVNGTGSSGHLNGENEMSVQNGSQDGVLKVGKLKFPKLEFSSPYKGKEIDSEMNLNLVKKEELDSKEETNESSFSSKFKSPKIAFSGFKKKDKGEYTAAMENVGEGDSKSGRGRISLGFLSSKSKGEYTVDNTGIEDDTEGSTSKDKSTKYKIPKLSLGTKTEVDSSKEIEKHIEEGSEEGFKISLPQVGFTTHQEEQITKEEETTLGFLKVTTKQIKTEIVTEKTLAI